MTIMTMFTQILMKNGKKIYSGIRFKECAVYDYVCMLDSDIMFIKCLSYPSIVVALNILL